MFFAKAKGKAAKTVFKIKENTDAPGEHKFSGKHSFIDMPTREHYPGEHQIVFIVNSVEETEAKLTLIK